MGLLLSLGLWGCPAAEQTCAANSECGDEGRCEASGFCSFSDDTCPTGRRYGESGPSGEGGQCVTAQGTTTGAVPPPPAEESEGTSGDGDPTSAGDESSEGGTTAATEECEVVSVEEAMLSYGDGIYEALVTPNQGDQVFEDFFRLEFGVPVAGTFTLGESDWASQSSCPHCLKIYKDIDVVFFADEGEITVATGSEPLDGRFQAQLSGVRLQEAIIDQDTQATEFVDDGDCLIIEDTNITSLVIPGWNCGSGNYENFVCNCGCGIPDPDCIDSSVASCENCDVPGSCSLGQGLCPAAIDPNDNAICDLTLWTCNPAAYDAGDDICDCGCGLIDPDCDGSTIETCTVCSNPGSCTMGNECSGYIDLFNNGQCGAYPGWTCGEEYYGDSPLSDGLCDCGCGIPDTDCEEPTLAACDYCTEFGSCTEEACIGNTELDPDDPSQCLP